MKKLKLGLLATFVALGTLLVPASAHAAGEWQDGKSDSDTIYDCVLKRLNTGVSANVGWWSPTGQVPKVGETFYLRMYAGLVGMPCSSGVTLIPKVVLPTGLEFANGEYKWDVWRSGVDTPDIRSRAFTYDELADGSTLLGDEAGSAFELARGDMFEFQIPVKSTREMKGPATRAPECQTRIDGDGPCPVAESGDHFQVGFTVDGHGGDKWYVTPYVPLFVATVGTGGGGGVPVTPGPTPVTPTPTTPTPVVKATSKTSATFKVTRGKAGKATVTVSSSVAVSGRVNVLDKGRTIARGTVAGGRATVKLPKLKKGKHQLSVRYLGSAGVQPSTSPTRTIRVR
ncbi:MULTISPECIES: Ig-like domain-containing protein [unclassified Nocardioides]|uniref:Ig-like domain-containing protein n=1 Tax=unclassified Nocardioides TaxID=2615069 RepID=UPI00361E3380